MSGLEMQFNRWAVAAQAVMIEYSQCFQPVSRKYLEKRTQAGYVVSELQLRAMGTSDSALSLICQSKLWDAEILVRTVMESTVRLVFICVDTEYAENRAEEFLVTLPQIASLKRHLRLEEFLARVPDPKSEEWRTFRDILSMENDIEEVREKLPKSKRDRISTKWGMAQIAAALGRSESSFKDLAAILYQYGMSSHSVHQDADAILMMREREEREPERIRAIELAHAAREMGDLMIFAMVRALAANRLYGLPPDPIRAVYDKSESFREELGQAHDAWHLIEYPPGRSPKEAAEPSA